MHTSQQPAIRRGAADFRVYLNPQSRTTMKRTMKMLLFFPSRMLLLKVGLLPKVT